VHALNAGDEVAIREVSCLLVHMDPVGSAHAVSSGIHHDSQCNHDPGFVNIIDSH
jgi:hypothetical protein